MRLFTLVAAVCLVATPAASQDLSGSARVIDGDEIEVAGQRIRIHGILAPMTKQLCSTGLDWTACGEEAIREMRDLIAGEPVRCEQHDVDGFGVFVGVCFNTQGLDLGKQMVRRGWALADRQSSFDYLADEEAASTTEEGMWRRTFAPPWGAVPLLWWQ